MYTLHRAWNNSRAIGHFLIIFRDLAEQIYCNLIARTNLLHIFNGEANNSL